MADAPNFGFLGIGSCVHTRSQNSGPVIEPQQLALPGVGKDANLEWLAFVRIVRRTVVRQCVRPFFSAGRLVGVPFFDNLRRVK